MRAAGGPGGRGRGGYSTAGFETEDCSYCTPSKSYHHDWSTFRDRCVCPAEYLVAYTHNFLTFGQSSEVRLNIPVLFRPGLGRVTC